MGNGVSSDQGNLPAHGKRDVRRAADRKQHDWSELAVALGTNSLLATANSYIGTSGVGPKSSTGNMYVAAEHTSRRTSRYIQETRYDDAVTSEFETGNTSRQHRRLPETREDNEQSLVMKDDRSSSERRSSRRREKTGSVLQLETDTGQTAYTPRWQKTGSAMQMESRDPRSRPIPTACIPPSLATRQPEGDRRTALPSLQLKTTSMPEDSARPASHTVAQQQEEEMAVEQKLAALQLGDTVDRFLPEPQMHNFRHKPETEIAKLHQRLIEQLQKLTADLNQRLTSDLYPTPYVGHDRPPTQIVAAGPEIQQPKVQLYDRYSDAHGAYHYRPSFYSPPGYPQCVYPNGVQYTSFPEIQHFSRPDNASYAYPYGVVGVPCPSQEVETRQVDKVLPEQQPSKGFSRQPEIDENTVARPNPESRQDATVKIPAETPETGSAELETVGAVSERRHRKGKVETDTRAGKTRHSPPKKLNTSSRNVRNGTADRTSTSIEDTARHRKAAKPDKGRRVPEVHNNEDTITIVKSPTFKLNAAPSITEDPAIILVGKNLQEYVGVEPRMRSTAKVADAAQRDGDCKGATGPYIPSFSANDEGKTPEMSSVTRLVSPRRGDILEGELGPYIPSSPVEDLSGQEVADEPQHENVSNREMEEAVWTTGEVHFGSAESADGLTNPSPTIRLERNRSDLALDRTDEEGNPTTAESMETAELKEFDPLVDCQLDTAKACLRPATGSTSQDTGSSDISENLPDQYTGRCDIQETGSLESQTAEKSEAAIIASSAQHAMGHVMIYPNSGSVNPFIIIENKSGEHLPLMNSDVTEATGSLDQVDREATVTTGVAGAEHKTWTGQQYTQIPRPHVEPALAEVGETSRTCNRSNSNVAYGATAEIEMENGNVTVADCRHEMAVYQVVEGRLV